MALSLMVAPMIPVGAEFVGVDLAIAIGGLLGARRVAETMSNKSLP